MWPAAIVCPAPRVKEVGGGIAPIQVHNRDECAFEHSFVMSIKALDTGSQSVARLKERAANHKGIAIWGSSDVPTDSCPSRSQVTRSSTSATKPECRGPQLC